MYSCGWLHRKRSAGSGKNIGCYTRGGGTPRNGNLGKAGLGRGKKAVGAGQQIRNHEWPQHCSCLSSPSSQLKLPFPSLSFPFIGYHPPSPLMPGPKPGAPARDRQEEASGEPTQAVWARRRSKLRKTLGQKDRNSQDQAMRVYRVVTSATKGGRWEPLEMVR